MLGCGHVGARDDAEGSAVRARRSSRPPARTAIRAHGSVSSGPNRWPIAAAAAPSASSAHASGSAGTRTGKASWSSITTARTPVSREAGVEDHVGGAAAGAPAPVRAERRRLAATAADGPLAGPPPEREGLAAVRAAQEAAVQLTPGRAGVEDLDHRSYRQAGRGRPAGGRGMWCCSLAAAPTSRNRTAGHGRPGQVIGEVPPPTKPHARHLSSQRRVPGKAK